jgi:hypothetical protein
MKKLLLAIIMAGSAHYASAQFSSPTKTTFGIKGGVNFASAQLSADGSSFTVNTGKLTNFSAGFFADIAVTESFSVQPGLYYSGKGFKLDNITTSFDFGDGLSGSSISERKTNIAYVQVPVNFLFNANTNVGKFFVGAGPFIAAAVNAKIKGYDEGSVTVAGKTETERQDVNEKIEIGSEEGIKRFDYGVTGMAGFRFNNGLLLSANYDLGLANISGAASENGKLKTRTIGISLGFSF